MKKNTSPVQIPDEYLSIIKINGMTGRKVTLPGRKNADPDKEIVLFYGHHASLERVYAIAKFFSSYGSVVMYDIPGFGGMDSFYKIGMKPSIENYADYLYAVLKTHKFKKNTILMGMSLTFIFLTRMLQKYPDMPEKFSAVVSFVGFVNYKNFRFYPKYLKYLKPIAGFAAWKPVTAFINIVVFNPLSLSIMMSLFLRYNPKFKSFKKSDVRDSIKAEKDLWRRNDLRTHFQTYLVMLTVEFDPNEKKLPMTAYDMTTENDQYFKKGSVTSSLKKIYHKVETSYLNLAVHSPSLIASEREVEGMIPESIKKELLGVDE